MRDAVLNGKTLVDTAHMWRALPLVVWHQNNEEPVSIIPDPKTGSLGHLCTPPRFISEMEKSDGNSGRATLQAERFVVGCLAGNAASCRYRKTKRRYLAGGQGDREQAIEVLIRLAGSGEELTAYFRLLQLRAEKLVALEKATARIRGIGRRWRNWLEYRRTLKCELSD